MIIRISDVSWIPPLHFHYCYIKLLSLCSRHASRKGPNAAKNKGNTADDAVIVPKWLTEMRDKSPEYLRGLEGKQKPTV